MELNVWALNGLTNAVGVVALGLFVYIKGREPRVKRSFGLLNFTIAAWCFSYSIWQIVSTKEAALFWARALTASSIFIAPTFLYFVFTFLSLEKGKKRILTIAYLPSFTFFALVFTPLFVKSVSRKLFFPYWPNPGPLYFLYPLHFFTCFLYSWYLLRQAILKSSYERSNQIKYILYGSIIGVFGGVTNWPLWWDIPIPPYGNSAVAIYVAILTYAVIKHRLMDINVVLRKSLVYSLLVTSITIVYFMLVWTLERAFQTVLGYQSIPLTIFSLLIIVILFQPIKNKIQAFVDKHFFKGTVDVLAEENERLQEELIKSEKLRIAGTLASGIAHEIKNPLTSLKTYTSYLEEKHNDPSFRKKFKEVMNHEINQIDHLVLNLLNFAKPHPLKFESADVHKALDRTFELINSSLAKADISLVRAYHRPNTEILGDPSQLQQAFLNIFLNAMDAMPNGGELKISTETEDGWLKIRIEDTGCGMTEEQLKHVFEPFYTTKEKGTGLGLAITKRIIEDHKGKIKVTSDPNKGSTFDISLPLC